MKKSLSAFLSILMILSMFPAINFSAFAVKQSDLPDDLILTSDTNYQIAPGISEEHITTVTKDSLYQNNSFVATIDFSEKNAANVGALAGYKDYDSSGKWGMQTVRDQARAAEKATGKNIVVAVNGDYYNMQTGEPTNSLVMGGKVVKDSQRAWYFAILKDGTPAIREGTQSLEDVQEAVGSPILLIKDGEIQPLDAVDFMPRGAIGITADKQVKIMVNDGRQAPSSVGYTMVQLANVMKALGCVDCVYLDGGGSATFATKSEGTESLTVKNSPSDRTERLVSSSIFFYSNAKPTGQFDHASLSPVGEVYTPQSVVEFSALGVDSAGNKADLPQNGQFELAADSSNLGSITPEGVFTASTSTGVVNVNYTVDGETVGSTSIEIAKIDEIVFPSEEYSLDFEETTDFNIVAKNNNRVLNIKGGDLVWTATDAENNDVMAEAGEFSGLNFTSNKDKSMEFTLTAYSALDESVKSSAKVIVGASSQMLFDFEYTTDSEEAANSEGKLKWIPSYNLPIFTRAPGESAIDNEGRTSPQFADYLYQQGYPLYSWPNASLGASAMNSKIVSRDDGEPVRFGDHSLRMDVDFSSYNGNGNSNNYLRVTSPNYFFEGAPKKIGAWVYVPEGMSNFALYLNCSEKANGICYAPVSLKDENGNVKNWVGWRYVEIDLTDSDVAGSNNIGPAHYPYGFYQGCGVFWISFQPGSGSGSKSASTVYLDNIQLIYSSNTDDTKNPVVNSIRYLSDEGFSDVSEGAVINSNTITFTAAYSDVEDKYMSGIDDSKVSILIDGVDVTNKAFVNEGDDIVNFYDANLANGRHSISVVVYDNFGNKTTETRYFTVEGDTAAKASIEAESEHPVLGSNYVLDIKAADLSNVTGAEIAVHTFAKLAYYYNNVSVAAAEGYELDGEPVFDSVNSIISFAVKKDSTDTVPADKVLARVVYSIPSNVPADSIEVSFRLDKAKLEIASAGEKELNSFGGTVSTSCVAPLVLSGETMLVGTSGGSFIVNDVNGNPVQGAQIFLADGTSISEDVTDENGKLFTDYFVNSVAEYSVYAKKDDSISFIYKSQSFESGGDQSGLSTDVILTAVKNSDTMMNVSWMSAPAYSADKAVIKFAEKSSYDEFGEEALQSVDGTSRLEELTSSGTIAGNKAIRFNRATLTNLKPNTEYVFCVGDGDKFSEIKNYKTTDGIDDTNFFIIGDMQDKDTTHLDAIIDSMANGSVDYTFGLQTGDALDNGGAYSWFENVGSIFANEYLSTKPIVHVLGNHEYYGDLTGQNASDYFGMDTREDGSSPYAYSATYGNTYIAVINDFSSSADYEKAIEWIKEDVKNTDAIWKVLSVHKPAYYTNPGGSSGVINRLLPPFVDEVGFDFIFSGHDHAYVRTNPVTGGQVDNENGAVYYICGSTGEKSYSVVENPDFPYAFVRGKDAVEGEYESIYLTASANDTSITVDTHEVTVAEDGTYQDVVIDSFTKQKQICESGIHTYSLTNDNYLICSKCGHKIKNKGTYTGLVTDYDTGLVRWLTAGVPDTDRWLQVGTKTYYLDENGFAATGEKEISGYKFSVAKNENEPITIKYKFDENGVCIPTYVDVQVTNPTTGEDETITRLYLGGVDAKTGELAFATRWYSANDNWYFFKKMVVAARYDDGALLKGGKFKITTSNKNTSRYSTFDENGVLILGGFEDDIDDDGNVVGSRYYFGPEYLTGEQVIEGFTYLFGDDGYIITKDIKDLDISLAKLSYNYNGSERKPAATISDGSNVLVKKTHFNITYSNNTEIGTAKATITGLANHGYTGTVEIPYEIVPAKVKDVSLVQDGVKNVKLSWSAVTGAEKYIIFKSSDGKKFEKLAETAALAYTDTSAKQAGSTVYYKVNAVKTVENKDYISKDADAAEITIAMTAPVVSSVASKAYNSLLVKWSKVSNAEGYSIYRSTSKNGTFKKIADATTNSYTDSTAKLGTTYYYKVLAFCKNGKATVNSPLSAAVGGKTALAKAVISSANAKNYKSITLKWGKVAGATGYLVYRSTAKNGTYKKLADVTSTSYTDSSAKLGTTFYYKIVAYAKVSSSTIKAAESAVNGGKSALAKPVISSVTPKDYRTITVKWGKVAGASTYIIYRSTAKNGTYKKIASVTSASYNDKSVQLGKTYYYKIVAYTKSDSTTYKSAASAVKGAKVAVSPTTITSIKADKNSATIKYSKVAGATGYIIYRASSKTGKYSKIKTIGSGSTVQFKDTGLKANSKYFYKVVALRTVSGTTYKSAASAVKGVTTKK